MYIIADLSVLYLSGYILYLFGYIFVRIRLSCSGLLHPYPVVVQQYLFIDQMLY